MAEPDQEPFLDLRTGPHRPKGRAFTISVAERIRISRWIPQAVVKVTSFAHGASRIHEHLRYITRHGKLPLEKDTGEILVSDEKQMDLAAEWTMELDPHPRSRDTANLVFSMPKGSDVEALRKAVRSVGVKAFPGHEWVFAIHEDREHPHAHMMVKMRGQERGKKLRFRKAELYHLRELFAEAAREQGIRLAASPRAARGVGQKGIRQSLYHLHRKGILPKVEKDAGKEVSLDLKHGPALEKPWERAMAQRHKREKENTLRQAQALRQAAEQKQGQEHESLTKAAQELERLARTLPTPKTRRQTFIERSRSTRSRGRTPASGLELDR